MVGMGGGVWTVCFQILQLLRLDDLCLRHKQYQKPFQISELLSLDVLALIGNDSFLFFLLVSLFQARLSYQKVCGMDFVSLQASEGTGQKVCAKVCASFSISLSKSLCTGEMEITEMFSLDLAVLRYLLQRGADIQRHVCVFCPLPQVISQYSLSLLPFESS